MRRTRGLFALVALAAAAPALASEGGAGGAALLTPQLGTIFWTVVTFVCLVLLLRRIAWGPLIAAIDAREQSIRDSIEQAKSDRSAAEKLVAEQREMLLAARRERAQAADEGRRDAERLKGEILDEARKQRDQVLKQSEAQLAAGLRQARSELRAEAADLALAAARQLIARNLDEPTHRRLVEEFIAGLERPGREPTLPT